MSRTTKPADVQPAAESPVLTMGDAPAVAALVALIGAVTALASFPSSPVPESLVRNVAQARENFLAVLGEPIPFPSLSAVAEPYDDAWIKSEFEGLGDRLKERFEGLDAAIAALTKRADEADPVDLKPIENRLDALERASAEAVVIDLEPIESRLDAIERSAGETKAAPASTGKA